MAQVREAFVDAAKRALRIGFDAIELHMAHGYLMHSFVSPISNKRNDAYGGSLEGRMKFPLEVLRAVRAVVPKGYAARRAHLGGRLDGRRPDRRRLGRMGQRAMKEAGLDFVDVSSGGVTAEVRTPTTPGYNVPIAEQIKRETGIATRAVGLIATRAAGRGRSSPSGKADMIALGRAHAGGPALGLDGGARSLARTSRVRSNICARRRSCGRALPIAATPRSRIFSGKR